MIRQLVQRLPPGGAATVLTADALDLVLHQAQVWDAFESTQSAAPPASPARKSLWSTAAFARYAPNESPAWDHLGYSFALENTRMAQIFARVVHEYSVGERLGNPSVATQRWLDTTRSLLQLDADAPGSLAGLAQRSTEAVRRNAYWRLLGMDLAFGTERNEAVAYEKAEASNTDFVALLEALLRAIRGAKSGPARPRLAADRHLVKVLSSMTPLHNALLVRRQSQRLAREELGAATVMGWLELSLEADSPVVKDLGVAADSAAARLAWVGEQVGLPAHQKSAALFALAADFSTLLRAIESDALEDTARQVVSADAPLAKVSHRVITHWSVATGVSL